jgi:hypothetical protein
MSPEPPDDCAWHYTSAAGLLGIIESNSLRATSAAFMNDANEMKTGVRALRSSFEKIEDQLSEAEVAIVRKSSLLGESSVFDLFLVSASRDPDLLTLWRSYGVEQVAYSIGFDRSVKLSPREHNDADSHPEPPPGYADDEWDEVDGEPVRLYDSDAVYSFGGTWRDVDYIERGGTPAHTSRIREFIERRERSIEKGSFIVDVGSIADSPVNLEKDSAFKDEQELRIVVELNPSWKFVRYRVSRFGLTPYIELAQTVGEDHVPAAARGRLPIRHIRIGPTTDSATAMRALEHFLDDHGYGEVGISVSDIPYR